jgi:hypothetical protein
MMMGESAPQGFVFNYQDGQMRWGAGIHMTKASDLQKRILQQMHSRE